MSHGVVSLSAAELAGEVEEVSRIDVELWAVADIDRFAGAIFGWPGNKGRLKSEACSSSNVVLMAVPIGLQYLNRREVLRTPSRDEMRPIDLWTAPGADSYGLTADGRVEVGCRALHIEQQCLRPAGRLLSHRTIQSVQKPYNVFFQMVARVEIASASDGRMPSPLVSGRRHTVVNCSNSNAIANAVCSAWRSAA